MSEWCEQMTSEWPSTSVLILGCSEPLCHVLLSYAVCTSVFCYLLLSPAVCFSVFCYLLLSSAVSSPVFCYLLFFLLSLFLSPAISHFFLLSQLLCFTVSYSLLLPLALLYCILLSFLCIPTVSYSFFPLVVSRYLTLLFCLLLLQTVAKQNISWLVAAIFLLSPAVGVSYSFQLPPVSSQRERKIEYSIQNEKEIFCCH